MRNSEWKEVKLSELIDIIGGGTPKTKVEEYWNGDIPWLSVRDFGGDNKKVWDTEKSITKLGLEKSSTKLLNKGDLIISARGTVGELAQLGKPMAFNQSCYGLRAKEDFTTNDFIYYVLKYILKDIQNATHGSVFDTITKTTFDKLSINLPSLDKQNKISKILNDIDDKIELNNQMNQTLEEMAQAIFKEWFVEFNFPNEDGVPYKDNGGEMIESELGMIPEGWRVVQASEIFNINIGKTPPRKEKECFSYNNSDIKWLSIKDMGNAGTFILDTSEYLTKESIKKYNVKIVPRGTIVLSFKLTVGRLGITNEDMATNEAIAHFNINNNGKMTKEYIYLYLKIFNYESLGSTSSIATAVNSKVIKAMPIIFPNEKAILTFTDKITNIFEMIRKNQEETNTLIKTRDTLLPKLMSGEVRI